MIYKVNFSNETPSQKGRKPSAFRIKVDRTLAIMEPNSNFTVWNKAGMTTKQLQSVLSAYACFYQEKTGRKFSTKSYKHGVKVTREY